MTFLFPHPVGHHGGHKPHKIRVIPRVKRLPERPRLCLWLFARTCLGYAIRAGCTTRLRACKVRAMLLTVLPARVAFPPRRHPRRKSPTLPTQPNQARWRGSRPRASHITLHGGRRHTSDSKRNLVRFTPCRLGGTEGPDARRPFAGPAPSSRGPAARARTWPRPPSPARTHAGAASR